MQLPGFDITDFKGLKLGGATLAAVAEFRAMFGAPGGDPVGLGISAGALKLINKYTGMVMSTGSGAKQPQLMS